MVPVQPVVLCCLLLCYPVLGAPMIKPEEDKVTVSKVDLQQVSKYTTEVIQGCSLYLNTFKSPADKTVPLQHCFVQPRPYNSSQDVFQLLAQDLSSARTLLNYTVKVAEYECKNITETLYRCAFITTNILGPLQNLIPVLEDLLPTDLHDSTTNGSGEQEDALLDEGDQDSSCWSTDDDRQQWNFYELQGLMTIINMDVMKLEDGKDESTPPSKV